MLRADLVEQEVGEAEAGERAVEGKAAENAAVARVVLAHVVMDPLAAHREVVASLRTATSFSLSWKVLLSVFWRIPRCRSLGPAAPKIMRAHAGDGLAAGDADRGVVVAKTVVLRGVVEHKLAPADPELVDHRRAEDPAPS